MTSQAVSELLSTDTVALEVLDSHVAANVAYIGTDSLPRVVPVAWVWRAGRIVFCTPSNAPKVEALRKNPNIAVSINLGTSPDRVLLLRGAVEIEIVSGVPREFIDANARLMPEDAVSGFEKATAEPYREMAIFRTTPTWAKSLDFIERLPDAIASS